MNRIAYYGTFGAPGHSFRAINGEFTEEEVTNLSKIDSPVYIEAAAADGFHYFGYDHFLGYGIPFSIDDRRRDVFQWYSLNTPLGRVTLLTPSMRFRS